eukprot:3104885-Pyramimonas_sp.AAC.1
MQNHPEGHFDRVLNQARAYRHDCLLRSPVVDPLLRGLGRRCRRCRGCRRLSLRRGSARNLHLLRAIL